jgi:hypothetical protein
VSNCLKRTGPELNPENSIQIVVKAFVSPPQLTRARKAPAPKGKMDAAKLAPFGGPTKSPQRSTEISQPTRGSGLSSKQKEEKEEVM